MSFFQIKNNDLATADVIMSNFRHVNYGNQLLPVDSSGNPNNLKLNLGSPVNKWNNLYINNVFVNDQVRYRNSEPGDMHYIDKNKNQKTIPMGEKGSFLKSNGKENSPEWVPYPFPLKKLIETDWLVLRKGTRFFKLLDLKREIEPEEVLIIIESLKNVKDFGKKVEDELGMRYTTTNATMVYSPKMGYVGLVYTFNKADKTKILISKESQRAIAMARGFSKRYVNNFQECGVFSADMKIKIYKAIFPE